MNNGEFNLNISLQVLASLNSYSMEQTNSLRCRKSPVTENPRYVPPLLIKLTYKKFEGKNYGKKTLQSAIF